MIDRATTPEQIATEIDALRHATDRRNSLPVIATGGIGDGRGVAAVLALGAQAAALGTSYHSCPSARARETSAEPADRCT